jgi:poly-gamma-glutamate synthesis protein (capsule biosynthesis protein)
VLQGIEQYKGAVIAYSLGNFVFGGNWNPGDKRTALLELKFRGGAFTGHKVIPAFSDKYPEVPVQPYLAEGDAGTAVLQHIENISRPLRSR